MGDFSLTALISIPEEAGYFFPNRHFERIFDNPLYKVMIDKLEANERIANIIVNTDSARIRDEYRRSKKVRVVDAYRAELQETEQELTSDKVTAAMLEHAEGEHFLQFGPIFPFVTLQTLDYAIDSYDRQVINPENWAYDSVFTIRVFNRRYFDSDTDLLRYDRPNTLVEDGIIHVFNRSAFLANGNRKVGKKPYIYNVDEIENLAIDSEENYRLATYIAEHQYFFPRVFGR